MLDIGLPRMISPNNLVATNVFRNLFSSLTHVVCFARGHVYFWKKILNFTNASFVPYGVDPSFYDDFSNCYSNYIFSAGRADRDYNTLLLAVRHIIRPPRLIVTYGKDQITFKSPHFKRDLTNYNVKLFYEVPYDLYLRLLKKSLLVVLPLKKTHYASGQVVLLEAMASGKAVIASRVIGTIDYIENWNTGIFVKPYDFKDLKEKIEYLMENPDERVRIGRNARKTIHERFNEKNMISEIVNTVRNYCA
jgi:glycosyltransferase involved in cell wall biosynthesis